MADESAETGTGLMDVDSKEFKDIESKLTGAPAEPARVETGKDAKALPLDESSATLSGKVAALEKELARVRGVKRDERDEEVVKLRERLAKMEGKLEAGKPASEKTIADYKDKELLAFKHQWDDALDTHRDAGDHEKAKIAKANIRLIESELLERGTGPKGPAKESSANDEETTKKELASIYEETLKDVPDLADKDSDIWKAAKLWYDAHPALMQKLGPLGDMMAVAKVIMKSPDLMKNVAKAARKDVLSNIEKATGQAMKTGGGGPEIKSVPDFANMTTDEFEKVERRLMAGLPLTG